MYTNIHRYIYIYTHTIIIRKKVTHTHTHTHTLTYTHNLKIHIHSYTEKNIYKTILKPLQHPYSFNVLNIKSKSRVKQTKVNIP